MRIERREAGAPTVGTCVGKVIAMMPDDWWELWLVTDRRGADGSLLVVSLETGRTVWCDPSEEVNVAPCAHVVWSGNPS